MCEKKDLGHRGHPEGVVKGHFFTIHVLTMKHYRTPKIICSVHTLAISNFHHTQGKKLSTWKTAKQTETDESTNCYNESR